MQVIMEVTERQIVPGETARFPFIVPMGEERPSILEFHVISDNPNFDPRWAHVVRSADGTRSPHYILEIRPAGVRRAHYGTYPLSMYWGSPGSYGYGEGRCTLTIRPCVRLMAKPTFKTWPGGMLSLSLENCGSAGIDVSVSVSHHGSNWSKGWEFELRTEDGPFEFSETFELPADGKGGKFELDISAEGISIVQMPIQARRFLISRKHIVTAAVVLAGAAAGSTLALAGTGPALISQSISFTSVPPSAPATGVTYVVAARGGGSGNPVTFSIDPSSTSSACSISGSTVTFGQLGSCVIDANQAGNGKYQAAPQARQAITANGAAKLAQSITFTSVPPSAPASGGTYVVAARGGGSGNPVTFSIDPSSTSSACSISGSTVTFGQLGSCVIDANQAGNGKYQAAPQARQAITANGAAKLAQSITFTSTPRSEVEYNVTAAGGGSENPVTFSIDSSSTSSACSISGSLVTFGQPGSCVIDANQAGNDKYQAAPQAQQTITVSAHTQSISFTAPSSGSDGMHATLSATGGGSGNPVVFSVDSSTVTGVCNVSGLNGTTVNYTGAAPASACVIDADQAGNAEYQPAPQVQQTITVNPIQ